MQSGQREEWPDVGSLGWTEDDQTGEEGMPLPGALRDHSVQSKGPELTGPGTAVRQVLCGALGIHHLSTKGDLARREKAGMGEKSSWLSWMAQRSGKKDLD